jgi:hypothetical protein
MDLLLIVVDVLLAILVFAAVVWPSAKELRHVYRRRALAQELERAHHSTTHRDPARPRLSMAGARRHDYASAWPDGTGVSAVRTADPGMELARRRTVASYVSRRVAADRALAARGQAIDELEIEEVPRG